MHIDELRARFNLSRHCIHKYVRDGIIPPPDGYGRTARYGAVHVTAIAAYRALKDNNSSQKAILAHCQEERISVVEYVRRREAYIRENGLSLGAI